MPKYKYSDEDIKAAIEKSISWAGVARIITGNDRIRTGHQSHFKKRAMLAGLNFSHFKGQAWNIGREYGPKRKLEEYLVNRGRFIQSHSLKLRLIKEGIKQHECEICKNSKWMGVAIPLELDHVDGHHDNNELSNLRVLCPNCHAQTDTYCSKNRTSR